MAWSSPTAPQRSGIRCYAWLNAFSFPQSHARFAQEVTSILPGSRGVVLYPGDEMDGAAGSRSVRRQARPKLVSALETDLAGLAFRPTARIPELRDENAWSFPRGRIMRAVDAMIDDVGRG
jgi:hypothetical protein